MGELTVGIRDLKARLSEYLRQVKRGQTIVITEHGRTVGRIMPVEPDLERRLQTLQDAGLATWNGQKLAPVQPPAVNRGERLVADLLVEMRE